MPTSDAIGDVEDRPVLPPPALRHQRDQLKRRVSFSSSAGPSVVIHPGSEARLEELLQADAGATVQNIAIEPRSHEFATTQLHTSCAALDAAGVAAWVADHAADEEKDGINQYSDDGATGLCLLAKMPPAQFEVATRLAQVLLDHGASPALSDPLGYTPLHWAAAVGNAPLVSVLLTGNIDVNDPSHRDGETPLHRAARFGQHNVLSVLMAHGGSLQSCNRALEQPYDVAGIQNEVVCESTRIETQRFMATLHPPLRTLLLHHPDCLEHVTTAGHQESPDRVTAILDAISTQPSLVSPRVELTSAFPMASFAALRRVHSAKYIDTLKRLHAQVQSVSHDGLMVLTPRLQVEVQGTLLAQAKNAEICDTNFSRGTLRAALRAAGSVCAAIDRVVRGDARNAFCIVRPPGHHAGASGLLRDAVSCGFCIINNVMVGAQYALDTYPSTVHRVAVVDFDAHHGNGTEDIVRARHQPENVLFVSLHCYGDGFYPGSGDLHDLSTNVYNVALPPCWSSSVEKGVHAFRHELERVVVPLLRAFSPDLVLLSAGFDGCHGDIGNKQHGQRDGPVGLDLRPDEFYWATKQLLHVANLCCNGRLVSVLEGGYGRKEKRSSKGLVLDTLQASAVAHVRALAGDFCHVDPPAVSPKAKRPQRQCSSTYKRATSTESSSSPDTSVETPAPTHRRRRHK
ncbi:hypothetical protein SPRG_13356 [Saprolegnia parasitica CBS 223.65]|uniref:histone deacetylase n=1 Tax=Saprolegnia parasitica (strain CBS 223.65) TaxID=695850 RepID=A0A067C4R7_SAPPC|nr:hypothetical protein SPRG_13356 [Saprolegnia parasitica CBS 223.65]KDO21546.1 hypothetical protein SPRG_13356 [Saprolegnia parasitica CBS 223.65]|eukprot:XP_012207724.1 hypothetical protein SPRG_13356 [Saprolegnia parasitica CBS 223.65]